MKVRYKIIVLVLILSLSINAIILYTLNEKNLLVNLSNKILYETEDFKNIEIPDIYNKNSLFSFESNVLEKDDFTSISILFNRASCIETGCITFAPNDAISNISS